ncbi:hypothetical protein I302_108425 [Kwoniella bestiolae CBS 10118]|uniref:Uncharacterized protein n=1 Tax=Kwoniella bestiolae CBS 10118 TaxID=1296100 RepID=A0A1B9FVQ4_9TREE|nr:hypothetical protein I302_07201 [Kwoniella bestiolae CBS 10118]OCF22856.1 hypothetical protein I302_07201 [Kwoniella bestiolae CBS 10118]
MTLLDLPIQSAVLAEILQKRNIPSRQAEGCLVEFVIKAWKEGRKVREWCRDIQQVLEVIYVTEPLRNVIRSAPMKTLLPFVNLVSNPYFPTTEPPLPPPLIPTVTLPNITRFQLIEALSRLSDENQHDGSRPFCDEPLIHELCLSYISTLWRDRKWKIPEGNNEGNLIDWISKSLTEVEFELQLQGETNIVPILHKFRFQLGFVTCSQLITRFNSNPFSSSSLLQHSITTSTESIHSTMREEENENDAKHLEIYLRSWIQRRLSVGLGHQAVLDEVSAIKIRIEDSENRALIDTVSEQEIGFCHTTSTALSTDQSGLLWSSPSTSPTRLNHDTTSTTKTEPEDLYSQLTSPSALSLLSFSRMGRKRSFSHHTPKWLYHKRNNSSSSKLRFPSSDRSRPSSGYFGGNTIPESSSLTSSSTVTFQFPAETNIRQSILSDDTTTTSRPRTTCRDDLTSSLMSLTDPEDVRTVLLNQLMEMKYHLHGHEDESWFLGGGREQAEELLSHLEKRMIGKKDLMGLKEVFVSMRSAFDLPPLVNTCYSSLGTYTQDRSDTSSPFKRGTLTEGVRGSLARDSINLEKFLDEVAQLPDTLEESRTGENEDGHEHEGDEDEGRLDLKDENPTYQPAEEKPRLTWYHGGSEDIYRTDGEHGSERSTKAFGRRQSTSAHSVLTITSLLTTDSQTEGTRLSCFEIQEAHKEYHTESKAVEYHFPLPPSTPPSASKSDWGRYERNSASFPDLTDLEKKYTRLPPKITSLRRSRTRISGSISHLTTEELGSSSVPSTPVASRTQLTLQHADEEEHLATHPAGDQSISSVEPISPTCPLSPSSMTEDSPSKSTFDTHIVTPTTTRHPYPYGCHQPLSTLSSEATLYHPHDYSHLVFPDRRRASLGPVDKSRRQLHRHFAIFDGEQVSPSRELRELGMEVGKKVEDPVTPTSKVTHLPGSDPSDTSKSDVTPRVRARSRISNPLKILPPPPCSQLQGKFSFMNMSRARNMSFTSSFGSSSPASSNKKDKYSSHSQTFSPKSPVPLMEVLDLFRRHQESKDGLSLWEVEDALYRLIQVEKDRCEKSNERWNEERKGRVRWLIEQVAIMLADPIYVAPISRVVSSLSPPSPSTPSSFSIVKLISRPSLPRYKSQPQFPTSFLSSPPRPEPARPSMTRRHTQACLSVGSVNSGISMYSTASAVGSDLDPDPQVELEEMIDFPFPSPSIGGMVINESTTSRWVSRDNTIKRMLRGYEDWDMPLPQRMEWPVPQLPVQAQRYRLGIRIGE